MPFAPQSLTFAVRFSLAFHVLAAVLVLEVIVHHIAVTLRCNHAHVAQRANVDLIGVELVEQRVFAHISVGKRVRAESDDQREQPDRTHAVFALEFADFRVAPELIA